MSKIFNKYSLPFESLKDITYGTEFNIYTTEMIKELLAVMDIETFVTLEVDVDFSMKRNV